MRGLVVGLLVGVALLPAPAYAAPHDREDQVAQSGSLVLRVEDAKVALDVLTHLVTRAGGTVEESTVDDPPHHATLVARVPDAALEPLLTTADSVGRVEDLQEDSQDMTARLPQLETQARLREAARDRLQALAAGSTDASLRETVLRAGEAAEGARANYESARESTRTARLTVVIDDGTPRPPMVMDEEGISEPVPLGAPGYLVVIGGLVLVSGLGWWLTARARSR